MKGMRNKVGRRIVKCPRCGEDHDMLSFKEMERSMGKFTHWAECPRTGDPILMYIEIEEPEKVTEGEG